MVTCCEDIRIRRLEARGLTINDQNERKLGTNARILSEYRRYMPVEIDNSGDDPSLAVEQILSYLLRRKDV